MASVRKKPTEMGKKIIKALDGRTQRWLSQKTDISDVDLSNRINGVFQFTQDQLDRINLILDLNLELASKENHNKV